MAYVAPSITTSGTTFALLKTQGASGTLKKLIAAQSATSAPAAAPTATATGGGQSITSPAAAITASANGGGRTIAKPSTAVTLSATGGGSTGGSLAAGTYYVTYTWVTACGGETTVGTSQASVTTSSGDIASATVPSLPTGTVAWNLYVGTATNTPFLYKKGLTGTVATLDSPVWYGDVAMASAPSPPAVNSTIGAIPAGAYFAAVTQYHANGETTIGSSVLASAVTITANAAPSGAPTGAGSSSGSTLPPGAYYYQVTYVDAYGNETAGTENASATTTTGTQILTVTFHDTSPDWVVTRNLYLTAAGGGTGTETLYATGISPVATTYVCSVAVPAGGRAVPTSGTSAAQVPSFTLPSPATGAVGLRLYLSNTGGTNSALVLYAGGITSTTYYANTAPWNGGTFAAGTAPPSANTTAGNMVAGTYYLKFTETNGFGETTASPESNQLAVSTGNIPLVTFPALQTGNIARNLYLTPYNGASGSEVFYQGGITTPTIALVNYSHSGTLAPTTAPTIATGTTSGGLLAPGGYLCTSTETNGSGGETQAGPESLSFTVTAQAAPTGTATVNVTGSGGSLAVATYFGRITYDDSTAGAGETLPGNTFTFTQTSAAEPVVTFNDGGLPAWASGRNLYLGTNPNILTLYATGITGTTYTMTGAWTGQVPAPSNAATGSAASTGGLLPAGAYYFCYTYTTPNGETTIGTSEVGSAVTVSAGNVLTVTFNDTLDTFGSVARNLYLSAAGGASLSETLYATGITGSTYVCKSAAWFNQLAPTGAAGARAIPGTNSAVIYEPTTNASSTNQPVVTFPSLQAGNNARNLYVTPAGGGSGSESQYATGVTTTTYTLSAAAPAAIVKPPTINSTVNSAAVFPTVTNTTGLTATNPVSGFVGNPRLQGINSIFTGRFKEQVWAPLEKIVGEFLRGEPVPYETVVEKVRDAHVPIAALAELVTELGTLLDANPGHYTLSQNAITNMKTIRAWSSSGE